jgi:hypothetical protein
MQEYDLSFLYLPPKNWPLRAEDWHDQVDRIIAYTRQTIVQEIEQVAKENDTQIIPFGIALAIARGKNED